MFYSELNNNNEFKNISNPLREERTNLAKEIF